MLTVVVAGGGTVCSSVEMAETFAARFFGLLGRRRAAEGTGLWLRPSSGVHTFGMRFAIDVIALDGELRVVALCRELRPWRVGALGRGTKSVLELPAGQIERAKVRLGDRLAVVMV